ncbi:alpha/beta fold hydrolase [Actinoplanes sp. NPDC026670]|uniref:thioesterase II family protein n=1 Tax=Actinoplanes sp. NPDC026670 TaxID=3154700 RepID=UPI003409BA43
MTEQWFRMPPARPDAGTRLVCLPYAGGSAAMYHTWDQLVPNDVEVCPAELPGRGRRIGEQPFSRLPPLVHALADAMKPLLDRPFALFGHSLGGLVAFELTRLLRRRGWPLPRNLFVSASAAPARHREPVLHNFSDAELKTRLRSLNGTPPEILDNDELMELILPVIRADFAVLESYEYQQELPLDVPITVFGGIHDRTVRPSQLEGWRSQSTRPHLRLLPGDHFFIHPMASEVVRLVVADLTPASAEPRRSAQPRGHPGSI